MGFKRVWDSSCPRVWDSWEADGVTWVIRDLKPEDDDEALKILTENFWVDELLCILTDFANDPVSTKCLSDFWRKCISQRMSLGCYAEINGQSKLVALNVCLVTFRGEESEEIVEGEAWKNVYGGLKLCNDRLDAFKLLGLDKILYAVGLVVHRDYRGARLGARILAAREPLALQNGILGTSTVFTATGSQKSAARAGFTTALTLTLKDLAEAGLDFPKDESRCIKVMWKNMGFKRVWDSSCPRVWDSWEADGVTWVIRDLRPEDDDEALKILTENFWVDELLCVLTDFANDPVSTKCLSDFWRKCISQRMSLGCYAEINGQSKLVALNVCLVTFRGEESEEIVEGEAWKNVYGGLKLCNDRLDAFKLLGLNKILYAVGLVVHRDYRGARLGAKILAAREPLALQNGILGTSTVFTATGSQKSAARAGFTTALTLTLKDLAEAGLDFPKDESRCIKVMWKKYVV